MHLSRLEIQGFKSFAKRTVFEFPEKSHADVKAKSITGIVGPNGSGKSNVSDAVRWVLGEQSFKLLRCKKPDEVIFGGSEKKARQGMAEVSLYLDNADHELPIEYSEVALTRRVYRDGETEYLLNNNRVRLFDILMLLARANFGQKSYSIIGQGMVDHIINISAFERKEFFDEATGVKQFQIKRDQAVNKLRRTRENLLQSNQIIAELEPRLRLLSRQVKKLEKRQEVEKQLRDLQRQYYAILLRRWETERGEHSERFGVEDALRAQLEATLSGLQTKLALLARAESGKDIFNNLQKDYNRLQGEKNDLLKDLTVIKGKMSLEYVKAGKQNLSWLADKKEDLTRRAAEIKESLSNIRARLAQKENFLAESEVRAADTEKELALARNDLARTREDLLIIKSQGRPDRTAESLQAVFKLGEKLKGIIGRVADVGRVEKMYEPALAVAAGGRLNAVVVADADTAVACIEYLKDNRLAPLTFYPLNRLSGAPAGKSAREALAQTGALALAVDLVACEPKFKKVFEQIFNSTIVMDSLANAKALNARERLVTLDGDLLEKGGVMKGGWRERAALSWGGASRDSLLSTAESKMKDIAALEIRTAELERERDRFSVDASALKVDLQVDATKVKGLEADEESLRREIFKIDEELAEGAIAPEKQDDFFKQLARKKEESERRLEKLEESLAGVRGKIDRFNLEEEKKKREVFNLQDEMQAVQMKLNEVSGRVHEVKIALARLAAKKEDLDKEIAGELGGEDLRQVTIAAAVNVDQLWLTIGKTKHDLEMIGGIDPEVVAEHREVSERFEFLSAQVRDLEKAIADLEKIVTELDELIGKQFGDSFKKINKAFQKYFEKIFDGGKARLELIQKEKIEETLAGEALSPTDDPPAETHNYASLLAGIEIMVAPPNKKIGNIAVLSGGERTMTSLALICAIIETNPAPFIVMDEVDAALDEANSEKLARILQELSYRSQFIVITHNRVVMHVADVLYGVAMGDDGVSQTLSLSLLEAEQKTEK